MAWQGNGADVNPNADPNTSHLSNMAVGLPGIPNDVLVISCAVNERLSICVGNNGCSAQPIFLAQVDALSSKILYAETKTGDFGDFASPWWTSTQASPTDADIYGVGFAGHSDRMNVIFADGHVKSLRPSQTIAPFNDSNSHKNRNGPDTVSVGAVSASQCSSASTRHFAEPPALMNSDRSVS